MGLRFRKSIRLVPGLKLNLSKKGLSSLSVGGKGMTYNIGRKGTRTTGSLPGSGLSYSHYEKYGKAGTETVINNETGEVTQRPVSTGAPRWLMPLFFAMIVGAVYFLRS